MFCNNCGKELDAGDVFCGYCGARQELVQAPQENPAVGDAAQGTQAGPAAQVASTSDAGVGPVASGNAAAAPVPGKRNSVTPIVIAVLLVAGAGAGFMLWRNSGVSPKLYYDSAGNVTRLENYGVFGRLVADSDGVAIYEWEYDKAGNTIRQECYGVDGRPTLNSNGVAIYEFEYDSAGNCIRTEYYGVDGRLTLNSYGSIAIVEWEYDSADNKIRQENYGVDGRLTLNSDGVAIYEWEYDSASNVVETRTYDVQGRLVN